MWFIFAIIALLCWSGSDLFSKIGSKPDDKLSHFKMVIAVGFVMGIHAFYTMFISGVEVTINDIIQYLPASLLYILSMVLGYVGLRYIELSLSSPICNSSGAIAAIACFFVFKESLEWYQIVAIIIICLGVIGLGVVVMKEDKELKALRQEKSNVKYTTSFLALLLPILYCLIDAAGTVADSIILESLNEDVANTAYELTFLLCGVVCFVYVLIKMLKNKERLQVKRETPKLVGGVFETAGQFFYIYAISSNAILAAPVISAYCVVSVLWSRIFLKEKLTWKHYLMIGVTVFGIIIMGVADGLMGG